jgi:hypothetical protein
MKFVSFPYIDQSSVIIRRVLKKLDPKLFVAFENHNTLQNLFFSRIKDKIPLEKNSGVVYPIPCSNCPEIYVGETRQLLAARLSQHKKG